MNSVGMERVEAGVTVEDHVAAVRTAWVERARSRLSQQRDSNGYARRGSGMDAKLSLFL
jgi:hypothetical protein